MDKIIDIYNLILHSNTLNFAIFLTILIVIFKKVDISSILENMCNKIRQSVEDSEKDRLNAQKSKTKAVEAVKNTEKEIENINSVADDKARILQEQIEQDTNIKIKNIQNNANRIIKFEEKSLTSALISNIGIKSVNKAKEQLLKEIGQNKELNLKFIDDSIEELNKAVLNDIY